MIKRFFLMGAVLLTGIGFLVSCHEEPVCPCYCDYTNGIVVYQGAPEADGCGWLILIDSVYYHPVNLHSDYQINNLPVKVTFDADPEVFRCGRGGTEIPSIRIREIGTRAQGIVILEEGQWDVLKMDPFHVDTAYVDGSRLMMKIGYSGGCRPHDFQLCKLPPNALNPPPIELALSHDSRGDMCEAYITEWMVFSLFQLREAGKNEVTFMLRGSPEMSAYYGKFTYRY